MGRKITLELPDDVSRYARTIAERTDKSLEAVLLEWLNLALNDAVEALPDDQILALCNATLDDDAQDALQTLLDKQAEGELSTEESARLDALMQRYRRGLVQKARAHKVAVERGLLKPLGED